MAWDIAKTVYESISFDTNPETANTTDLFFKPDGTKVYVLDDTGNTVYQYSLSTAWNISTASYDSKSYALADVAGSGVASGIYIKSDGTVLWVSAYSAGDSTIKSYTMSTPWDISTASATATLDIDATITGEVSIGALFFKSDGTRVYVCGLTTSKVYSFDLSTAWDISSTVSNVQNSNTDSQDASPEGLFFKDDGTKMFVLGTNNDSVFQYTLGTAWDSNGASYDSKSLSVNAQETIPQGVAFGNEGTKMYIIGQGNVIYQYSVGGFTPQIIIL